MLINVDKFGLVWSSLARFWHSFGSVWVSLGWFGSVWIDAGVVDARMNYVFEFHIYIYIRADSHCIDNVYLTLF